MIAPEVIDYIKSQVNIVDIASKYVTIKKEGFKNIATCPFCNGEDKVEFSQEKQYFRCSNCNVGGNVFTFVQKIENLSFPNAVKKVSELAGLEFTQIVKEQDNSLHLVVTGSSEEKEKVIKFLEENNIKYIKNSK